MSAEMPLRKILHLIPSDTIGGVETAAHSIVSGCHGNVYLEKYFMTFDPTQNWRRQNDIYGPTVSLNHPKVYLAAVRHVLRTKPDLVVASLWRSVVVLIICKFLRPSLKTVVFLHSTSTGHATDHIVNALGMRLATEIWTDSSATLNARLWPAVRHKGKVVSFLLNRLKAPPKSDVEPGFIFWGRLRKQKNVRRAVAIFNKIHAVFDNAKFRIIGPDGGEEGRIADDILDLELEGAVSMLGPEDHDGITQAAQSAHFYLQTSEYEGMSMSVVEAMQLGLIPVVTRVGEVGTYCTDNVNSVIVKNDEQTLTAIAAILNNPYKAKAMAQAAVDTWVDVPLYRDDFLRLARGLLAQSHADTSQYPLPEV